MSKVANMTITRGDKEILREDVEYLLKNGTQDELELVKRAFQTAIYHADLKKNGFKIKRDGSAITIIPPKKPTKTAQGMIELMTAQRKQLTDRVFGPTRPKPPVQFAKPIPLLKQAAAIEKYLAGLKGNEFNRSFSFLDHTGEIGVSGTIDLAGFAFCGAGRLGRANQAGRSNVHVIFVANSSEKATLGIEFTAFSVGLGARWISSRGDGSIKATASMGPGRFELEIALTRQRNSNCKDFADAMLGASVFEDFHHAVDFAADIPDFAKAAIANWAVFFLGRELRNLFGSAITNCLALLPRAVLPQEEEPSPRSIAC